MSSSSAPPSSGYGNSLAGAVNGPTTFGNPTVNGSKAVKPPELMGAAPPPQAVGAGQFTRQITPSARAQALMAQMQQREQARRDAINAQRQKTYQQQVAANEAQAARTRAMVQAWGQAGRSTQR
jgi:hypothetical protein